MAVGALHELPLKTRERLLRSAPTQKVGVAQESEKTGCASTKVSGLHEVPLNTDAFSLARAQYVDVGHETPEGLPSPSGGGAVVHVLPLNVISSFWLVATTQSEGELHEIAFPRLVGLLSCVGAPHTKPGVEAPLFV